MILTINCQEDETIKDSAGIDYLLSTHSIFIYKYQIFNQNKKVAHVYYQLFAIKKNIITYNLIEKIAKFISLNYKHYISITIFNIFCTPFVFNYQYIYLISKKDTNAYHIATSKDNFNDFRLAIINGTIKAYDSYFKNNSYYPANFENFNINHLYDYYIDLNNYLKAQALLSSMR